MSTKSLYEMLDADVEMTSEEFAVENIICPEGVWPATVAGMGKVGKAISRRHGVGKESGNPWFCLNINFKIEDPEVTEHCKQDAIFVTKGIMLNIDEDLSQNIDDEDANNHLWVIPKDGNPEFGKFIRWAEKAGYQRPAGWAKFWVNLSDDLTGKDCMVQVKHRLVKTKDLDDDGNPVEVVRAEVSSIALAQ